jgi:hypothetical protein
MTGGEAIKAESAELPEYWYHPAAGHGPGVGQYRAAILVECSINFRSLRAGLNHSEERSYTAWLPNDDLAIDWDSPAAIVDPGARLGTRPEPGIEISNEDITGAKARFEQFRIELIERLVRNERLSIFFNPVFGLFSDPGDEREDFLGRVAEAALRRVEPEMRRLRATFELRLEQLREAHSWGGAHAEELSFESLISHKLCFFESENRLAAMFSTMAGSVFGSTEPRVRDPVQIADEAELREDLALVEREAGEALRALYDEYLLLANEFDVFEIGLQPTNIQVIRQALLWIPIRVASES